MVDGRKVSDVTFHPYPLPTFWIDTTLTGRVSYNVDVTWIYDTANGAYQRYKTRKINNDDIAVRGGEVVDGSEGIYRSCFSTDIKQEVFYCVYRGFGMGYLFKVGPTSFSSSLVCSNYY